MHTTVFVAACTNPQVKRPEPRTDNDGMRSVVPRSAAPWLALVTLTAAGAAAAAGYGLTAPKQYRATAELLVSPVPAGDATFTGLGVLRDSGGRRTAAASAAALIRSPQVADQVRAQLGLTRSRDSLLNGLHTRVVDSSDVVAVTFEDTSATGAAQLANAFAAAFVSQRTASFQSQLTSAIRREVQLLAATPGSAELQRRVAVLRGLQGQPDPTLREAAQASAPSSASWPKLPRLVAAGAGAGLAAGVVVAALLLLLARRGAADQRESYDRGVSDRLVQRFDERIDALLAEQERLAAREAALATREREILAKLDELRAVATPTELPAADPELARRERELEERVVALTHRELELARRAAAVAAQAREAEAAAEVLERRTEELEEWASELDSRAEEQPPEEHPALAEPAPATEAPGPAGDGRWNLFALERLVEQHGEEFPDRLDEWSSYLYFLREYANPDGSVPASFDGLIEDTFGELVA
jgi:capsular polysaccharide biosynthesis protein